MKTKLVDIYLLLLAVCCCAAFAACGASTQLVAATTTTGHTYPYCLEVTYPVLALQADVVFCGTIGAVQSEQANVAKLYPQAKLAIVKGASLELDRK